MVLPPQTLLPNDITLTHDALATRFRLDDHVVAVLDGARTSGKANEDRVRRTKRPFTVDTLQRHVEQPLGLCGLYMHTAPGLVRSLCLDVDVYSLDLADVAGTWTQAARRAGWPLTPIRSKSGGLHLWGYLAEDTDWQLVHTRLLELGTALRLPEKRDSYPNTPQLTGRMVWLPYAGAASPEGARSYVLDADGQPAGLHAWRLGLSDTVDPSVLARPVRVRARGASAAVDAPAPAAPKKRTRRAAPADDATTASAAPEPARPRVALPIIADESTDTAFRDGPPCLQQLQRHGGCGGAWTEHKVRQTMVYFALQGASEGQLVASARKLLVQAFHDTEPVHDRTLMAKARAVLRDMETGRLGYLCTVEPWVTHCEQSTCSTRRFGVAHVPSAVVKRQQADRDAAELSAKSRAIRDLLGGSAHVRLIAETVPERDEAVAYRLRVLAETTEVTVRFPNVAKLRAWREASARLLEKLGVGVPLVAALRQAGVSAKDWTAFADELLQTVEHERSDDTLDDVRSVIVLMLSWFARADQRASLDEVHAKGGYLLRDGLVYFRASDLSDYLATVGNRRAQHADVRAAYAELSVHGSTPMRSEQGRVVRMAHVPYDVIAEALQQAERVPTPTPRADAPSAPTLPPVEGL